MLLRNLMASSCLSLMSSFLFRRIYSQDFSFTWVSPFRAQGRKKSISCVSSWILPLGLTSISLLHHHSARERKPALRWGISSSWVCTSDLSRRKMTRRRADGGREEKGGSPDVSCSVERFLDRYDSGAFLCERHFILFYFFLNPRN